MNCETCQSLLVEYLYGELDAERRAEVDIELANCPACAQELQALRSTSNAFSALEDIEVPARLHADILRGARLHAAEVRPASTPWANLLRHPAFAVSFSVIVLGSAGYLFHWMTFGGTSADLEPAATVPAVVARAPEADEAREEAAAGEGLARALEDEAAYERETANEEQPDLQAQAVGQPTTVAPAAPEPVEEPRASSVRSGRDPTEAALDGVDRDERQRFEEPRGTRTAGARDRERGEEDYRPSPDETSERRAQREADLGSMANVFPSAPPAPADDGRRSRDSSTRDGPVAQSAPSRQRGDAAAAAPGAGGAYGLGSNSGASGSTSTSSADDYGDDLVAEALSPAEPPAEEPEDEEEASGMLLFDSDGDVHSPDPERTIAEGRALGGAPGGWEDDWDALRRNGGEYEPSPRSEAEPAAAPMPDDVDDSAMARADAADEGGFEANSVEEAYTDGTSRYDRGDYRRAVRALNRFLDTSESGDNRRPEATYLAAASHIRLGNDATAEALLESLLRAWPDHALADEARTLLEDIRRRSGDEPVRNRSSRPAVDTLESTGVE